MVKKVLIVLAVLALVSGGAAAWAAPVTYGNTQYHLFGSVNAIEPYQAAYDHQSSTTLPLAAAAYLNPASATAEVPDGTSFASKAVSADFAYYVYSQSGASAVLSFTATTPQINIRYDYGISVFAQVGETGWDYPILYGFPLLPDAFSSAQISSHIPDPINQNSSIWSFSREASIHNGSDAASGSVNVLVNVVPGLDYTLILGTYTASQAQNYLHGAEGWAEAWIKNLDVQVVVVPVPPTLLLFAPGLAALLARLRRQVL